MRPSLTTWFTCKPRHEFWFRRFLFSFSSIILPFCWSSSTNSSRNHTMAITTTTTCEVKTKTITLEGARARVMYHLKLHTTSVVANSSRTQLPSRSNVKSVRFADTNGHSKKRRGKKMHRRVHKKSIRVSKLAPCRPCARASTPPLFVTSDEMKQREAQDPARVHGSLKNVGLQLLLEHLACFDHEQAANCLLSLHNDASVSNSAIALLSLSCPHPPRLPKTRL